MVLSLNPWRACTISGSSPLPARYRHYVCASPSPRAPEETEGKRPNHPGSGGSRLMSRALVIAVSFLSMVTAVHAQTTDPPAFSVGDTWKFSDGREVTVVKVDENGSALTGGLRDC